MSVAAGYSAPGLNVLTGETGAGKSILMGALYSSLGGPASADLVRGGADRCLVEGLLEFSESDSAFARLQALDCPLEDGQLILRREIRASGRSRAFVNGLTVPLDTIVSEEDQVAAFSAIGGG